MTTIVARTARQILRKFELGDAPGMFALNGDPDVVRYTGDGPFASLEATIEFIKAYDPYTTEGMGRWACIDIATNEFLGWCGLRVQPDGEVDLGYRYLRSAWGRGLCTEAARASLAIGFGELALKTIVARAAHDNTASIAVMRKLGMRYEGTSMCAEHPGVLYRIDASDYAGAPK